MAGSRALPDLVSRIRIDSSGVDAAVSNLIGSFGRATLAMSGLAAGIGILVIGGKSMIDIAKKHQDAEDSLAQAIAARNSAQKKTAPNLTEVKKATKDLASAQRDLAEFDAGHKGTSSRVVKGMTTLDKMNRQDIQTRIAQARNIEQLTRAQRELAKFDVGHKDRAIAGHGLSQVEQMRRQDLVAKVAEQQRALAAATAQVNKEQTKSTKINGPALQAQMKSFIKDNREFISDQSEVVNGYAKLTRSGLSAEQVQKDMNRALDIAAIKHISVSDAVELVNQAEHGRLRGLIDLGITTNEYVDSEGNLVRGSKDVGKAMDELDSKTKGGRNTISDYQRKTNILSADWQDLSQKGGPVLITLLTQVVEKVTAIYDWFDKVGHDDDLWSAISDRLVKMGSWIKQYVLDPLTAAGAALSKLPTGGDTTVGGNITGNSKPGGTAPGPGSQTYLFGPGSPSTRVVDPAIGKRAGGGPVLPGRVYRVGENEEETLYMDPRGGGGYVVPGVGGGGRGGGGGTVIVQIDSPVILDGLQVGRFVDKRIIRQKRGLSTPH